MAAVINTIVTMYSFPPPAIVAALAAAVTLPFSLAAAGTLFLTAGLGCILHADYAVRHNRIRLPRRPAPMRASTTRTPFRDESHPLAA